MKRIDELEKEVAELNAKVEELLQRARAHNAKSMLFAQQLKKHMDIKKFKQQMREYF